MNWFLILLLLVWLISLLAWWGVTLALKSSDVNRIRARISRDYHAEDAKGKAALQALTLLPKQDKTKEQIALRVLDKLRLSIRMRELLEQAGLKWHIGRLVHGSLGLFLTGFCAIWLGAPKAGLVAAVGVGTVGAAGPLLFVLHKRRLRLKRFEEQFPEALEFVARSMRAGHAFSISLEMLHREFEDPLAGEFRRTFEEHNLGLPLDAALEKLARRVPLLDVQFLVSAVMLQKRTGGNLSELLDKLAYLIRERFKLRGRIRAVSAHGRMTGVALTAIPIFVALIMFFVNRDYVSFFCQDPTGRIMIGAAVLLQVVGYGIIRKIVHIEA